LCEAGLLRNFSTLRSAASRFLCKSRKTEGIGEERYLSLILIREQDTPEISCPRRLRSAIKCVAHEFSYQDEPYPRHSLKRYRKTSVIENVQLLALDGEISTNRTKSLLIWAANTTATPQLPDPIRSENDAEHAHTTTLTTAAS